MDPFEPEEEKESNNNSGRWLLTYSDMITLLLALFIILYSISAVDAQKFKEISEGMSSALNNPQASQSQTVDAGGSDGTAAQVENSLDKIADEIKVYLKENNLEDDFDITQTSDYVRISIRDSVLFAPDRAAMLPKSIPIVDKVADILKSVYAGIDHITISGYTADVGEDTISAWRLSANRAIAVLNEFINCGMDQSKFSVEGNSRYQPVVPNDTPENMAKNRRVEITITKNIVNGGIIEVPQA